MEFLTQKQRSEKARRLWLGYVLLSVLVVLATYVMVSTARGYPLLTKEGEVVQNGLLFVDSRPNNADVYINDKRESNQTNAKFVVPESTYNITLKKPGYRDWNSSIALGGGTVEFMTYARLLPEQPQQLGTLAITDTKNLQSRDKRWLLTRTPNQPAIITLVDLDDPTKLPGKLNMVGELVGNKEVTQIQYLEWAGDNKHFIARLTYADNGSEYYLINREDLAASFNLSTMFTIDPADVVGVWDGKWDKIFIKKPSGIVQLGAVKDKAIENAQLLPENVDKVFAFGSERAVYTVRNDQEVTVKLYADKKTYTITTTTDLEGTILAKSFGFNRNDYIVLGGTAFDKTYIYRNFLELIDKSTTGRVAPFFTMPKSSNVIDAARSNRFVMGTDGVHVQVYDMEQKDFVQYDSPTKNPSLIGWVDDARIYAVGKDNVLKVYDFNGNNIYEIDSNVFGAPYADSDTSVLAYVTRDNPTESVMQFIDILNVD